MVESSKKVKPWREDVRAAALQAINGIDLATPDGEQQAREQLHRIRGDWKHPITVRATFFLPRPKSHYRTGRHSQLLREAAPARPATTPDLDKLIRSTLDALGSAGVYRDDSQIVSVTAAKVYADFVRPPGAIIRIGSGGSYERPVSEVTA